VDFLWIKLLRHGRKIGHISKEHCHQLSFPFDGTSVREDLIGQKLGCVRFGLVVVDGRGFFRLPKIASTLITESILRRILRAAMRAYLRKPNPAPTAKLSPFSIIKLASWAFHGQCPPSKAGIDAKDKLGGIALSTVAIYPTEDFVSNSGNLIFEFSTILLVAFGLGLAQK
jgi:hypothetical protein